MNRQINEQPRIKLDEKDVMMGFNEGGRIWRHAIIIGKSIITSRKMLNVESFISRMRNDFRIEKLAALVKSSYPTFCKKWGALSEFFGRERPRQSM